MFVHFLKQAPFVRLVVLLATGIITGYEGWIPVWFCFYAWWGLILTSLYFPRFSPASIYRWGWAHTWLLQLLVACTGALLVYAADGRSASRYFAGLLKPGDWLLATLEEPLQSRKASFKTIVRVEGIIRRDSYLPANGRLLVYLPEDGLQCGDRLLLQPVLQATPGTYYANHMVYYQAFVREWRAAPPSSGNYLNKVLLAARNYCLRVFDGYIGGTEASLGAALLIGYRFELEQGMVQDYMNTGIVHIIAISGMHMALIYVSLIWLLQWWQRRWAKALFILTLLWLFTLLTGASASVLRATVMFSFITVGRLILERHASFYNTLAASAFVLLCYDPYLLFDVGFQLSYLAVLSITICYKPLYQLFNVRFWWLNKLWQATALSLAAQVITLPACLYYFKQFPLYFLPANLLAVPLSTGVLYGELLLLIIPVAWLGKLLKWIMLVMNSMVAWLGNLPGALITGISFPLYAVFCCYGCMTGLLAWWLLGWRKGVLVTLSCVLVWILCGKVIATS